MLLCDLKPFPAEQVVPLLAQALGRPEQAPELFREYQTRSNTVLFGWLADQQVLALAGLEYAQGAGILKHLAVAAAWRKRGLGRSLLQACLARLSLYRLDAETDAEAVGFYRQLGWAILPLQSDSTQYKTQRFRVFWLDAEQILAEDFRFPAPALDALYLPDVPHANVSMLRLDQLHPLLSGNKWFKLKPYLQAARQQGLRKIVTFGGAWSNHLFATAAAGRMLGLETVGIVRGELSEPLNPVLEFARGCGMTLQAVSRSRYRELRTEPEALQADFPDALVIPEGGAGSLGVLGASGILDYLPEHTHTLALAMGTGTTLAGLLSAAPAGLNLLGVAVLKGADFLRQDVAAWLPEPKDLNHNWTLETRFHGGGYGRTCPELIHFLTRFRALNPEIPVEPVYTGKLLWAINERLSKGLELPDPLLLLHTGGVMPVN